MKSIARLLVSLFVVCLGQLCAQTSLNFNLGGPGETVSDSFVYASGGVTATATAFSSSRGAPGATFQESQIVRWSPGIGVKNSTETITTVPYYVDNQDHYDFVLFVFSNKVDVTSVQLHPSADTFDSDVFYWMGNIDAGADLFRSSISSLSGLGFGTRIDNDTAPRNSPRTLGVTTPTGGVNALLVAARIHGDAGNDRFKISSINGTTVIPEPSTAGLLACSLAFALRRRRK